MRNCCKNKKIYFNFLGMLKKIVIHFKVKISKKSFLIIAENCCKNKKIYFNFLGMSKNTPLGTIRRGTVYMFFYLCLAFLILVSRQEMSKKGSDQHFITKFGIYIYIIVHIGVA